MSNYRYTIIKQRNKRRKCISNSFVIELVQEGADVRSAILQQLLANKRDKRLKKLINGYNGDTNDLKSFRSYLPEEYRNYAHDLNFLSEQLASLYDITDKYRITDIISISQCRGCVWERMGQKDHMECNTGCLHDSRLCDICSINI